MTFKYMYNVAYVCPFLSTNALFASYSWTLTVITPFTLKFYEKKYFCLIYLRPNNGLERQVWNFAVLANSGQNNN